MKVHSTNYFDTFILAASDFKSDHSLIPIRKEKETIARMQYDLLHNHPYQYTSDELLFKIHLQRKAISQENVDQARQDFFAKGQACLRASPLTKTHGFGIHANNLGKLALYGMETKAYQNLVADPTIKFVQAMKSKK